MENARRLQLSGVDLKDDSDHLLAGKNASPSLESTDQGL
jgi:hypothetical protein